MEDFVYSTPQDRLLIMMLERLEKLEDEVAKSNKNMEKILTFITSEYFLIPIDGKFQNGKRSIIKPLEERIKNEIEKIIPCKMVMIYYNQQFYTSDVDGSNGGIYIQTESRWLLDELREKLYIPVNQYVNTGIFTKLSIIPDYIFRRNT